MEEIYNWLKQNYKQYNEGILKRWANDLSKYADIKEEFCNYIKTGEVLSKVVVEGYSAGDILETGKMDVIGAYNFLVWLKEDPKTALDEIKHGLPIK